MAWWLASLVSNVCIMFIEHANHHATDGWVSVLPRTFLPIVLAQWCLFINFNSAPHWLAAWAMFVLGNSTMRVVLVAASPNAAVGNWWWVLGGIAAMLVGSMAIKQGIF